MGKKEFDSKLSEILGARIEAFGNYVKQNKEFSLILKIPSSIFCEWQKLVNDVNVRKKMS